MGVIDNNVDPVFWLPADRTLELLIQADPKAHVSWRDRHRLDRRKRNAAVHTSPDLSREIRDLLGAVPANIEIVVSQIAVEQRSKCLGNILRMRKGPYLFAVAENFEGRLLDDRLIDEIRYD